jgi:acetyl esterase/lipase
MAVVMDSIGLYDGPAPGSEDWTQPELRYSSGTIDTETVANVSSPTITPVLPADGTGNGSAVIIAPGGGYHTLSIQSEGFMVAERLAEHGIAAFVLAYRLVQCEGDPSAEMARKATGDFEALFADMNRVAPLAAADAEAAVRLVRARAGDFGVDPARVGFMGFSAGGNVTVRVALTDDPTARPDFVAPIYATLTGVDLGTAPDTVPEGSGPMFVVAATNDELGLARDSLALYDAWRRARLPVELHLYASGGHGFGMRTQHLPSDTWIDRFLDWFTATGLSTP